MGITKLFCLPFAGGNKYSYRTFEINAPSYLNIISLEYPGRGSRVGEPLISDINLLVDDLYFQIKGQIGAGNYAMYGHSMGGLIACLLTKQIVKNNLCAPSHLFITGTSGPSAPSREEKKIHLLNKSEFIKEIKSLNGSKDEVLDNEDILSFYEPVLRADFKASETYLYKETDPLSVPFTIITGTDEDIELSDVYLWKKETNARVNFKQLPGDHFFILKYPREIMKIVSIEILSK